MIIIKIAVFLLFLIYSLSCSNKEDSSNKINDDFRRSKVILPKMTPKNYKDNELIRSSDSKKSSNKTKTSNIKDDKNENEKLGSQKQNASVAEKSTEKKLDFLKNKSKQSQLKRSQSEKSFDSMMLLVNDKQPKILDDFALEKRSTKNNRHLETPSLKPIHLKRIDNVREKPSIDCADSTIGGTSNENKSKLDNNQSSSKKSQKIGKQSSLKKLYGVESDKSISSSEDSTSLNSDSFPKKMSTVEEKKMKNVTIKKTKKMNAEKKSPNYSESSHQTETKKSKEKVSKVEGDSIYLSENIKHYKKPSPYIPKEYRRQPINWNNVMNSDIVKKMYKDANYVSNITSAMYQHPNNYPSEGAMSVESAKKSTSPKSLFEKAKNLVNFKCVDPTKIESDGSHKPNTSSSTTKTRQIPSSLQKSTSELSKTKHNTNNQAPELNKSKTFPTHPEKIPNKTSPLNNNYFTSSEYNYEIINDTPSLNNTSKSINSAAYLFEQWIESILISTLNQPPKDILVPFAKNNIITINPIACCMEMAKYVYDPPFGFVATLKPPEDLYIFKEDVNKFYLALNTCSVNCYIWNNDGPDPRNKNFVRKVRESLLEDPMKYYHETHGILIPGPKRDSFFTLKQYKGNNSKKAHIYSYHVVDYEATVFNLKDIYGKTRFHITKIP